ncbi:hypothetical protein Pmani_030736 [Petrolisthes manimaculis]|uniref:Uncharacterized protein n=1 Tax=Petrolisthes manimaculis TaxID=1843537 RepID=A0AAE1NV10_9EUCA|nr:hypothetical protein Pmani_030736 [Petrolisthes manimaculis]
MADDAELVTTTTNSSAANMELASLRAMLEDILQSGCKNASRMVLKEVKELLQEDNNNITSTTPTTATREKNPEDSLAVVYIVFVLLFFAASLLVLLVKYLRRERESTRLQKFYEDYLENKTPSMVVHYDTSGRRLQAQISRDSTTHTPTPMPTPPTTPIDPSTASPIHATEMLEHMF